MKGIHKNCVTLRTRKECEDRAYHMLWYWSSFQRPFSIFLCVFNPLHTNRAIQVPFTLTLNNLVSSYFIESIFCASFSFCRIKRPWSTIPQVFPRFTFKRCPSVIRHFLGIQGDHVTSNQKDCASSLIILCYSIPCSIAALSCSILALSPLFLDLNSFGFLISTACVSWCARLICVIAKRRFYF